jgi:hypothetical protein
MFADENFFVMIFLALQREPLEWMYQSRLFAVLDNKLKRMESVLRPDISRTINTIQAKGMFWHAQKLMEAAMNSLLFLSAALAVQ